MKNYFNAEERTRHIILLAMQSNLEDMLNSEALSNEERTFLKYCKTYITKFNGSIFNRYGESYKRKIVGTMRSNDLRLVGKYANKIDCISYSASEDLKGAIDELRMSCIDCKRCDYTNCSVYAISVSCDIDGNGKSTGCPYAVSTDDFEEEALKEIRF